MLTDTTRKMASVQEIASLSPIENSDFLEVAMMKDLGWKVVVKKGEFKVGDKVVYLEIDSAIDVNDLPDELKFLQDKGVRKIYTGKTPESSAFSGEYVRIKTIKLRGQISQGLIIPSTTDAEVGTDLTETFKVEVWDRLLEWYNDRSQTGPRASYHPRTNFPTDVPKTDEERIQNCFVDLVKDQANVDGMWEATIKNDGSSCTLFFRPKTWKDNEGGIMQIASRRFLIKDDGNSDDWFAAFKKMGWDDLKYKLDSLYGIGLVRKADGVEEFPACHELAIQGEMIGPKFNGNRDKNNESHFKVFRIFDITDQKFVTPEIRYAICGYLGLEHVKVLETAQFFHRFKNVDDFLAYADGPSENGNAREGVVFKRVDDGSVSFKSVSNKYLLKQD